MRSIRPTELSVNTFAMPNGILTQEQSKDWRIGSPAPREEIFDATVVKLNYLDYGSSSAEPLVLLHGGAWRWQEFLSLIPSLARRWRTYALDLRGNGRSGWVPNAYRLQDFTDDNAKFIERLNAPAVLVGHSIGGV